MILRIRMRYTPTSNGKTSCGRRGVPRARPGQAPSLSVCEPCGHQRLPSAHESQDVESSLSQGIRRFDLHQSLYIGLERTHLSSSSQPRQ
jgi:hypothetical protein